VFEVYVFENKYSLSINLGDCNYPNNLEDVQITKHLSLLSFLTPIEGYSTANCIIRKSDLKKWILNSDFEVLSFIERDSGRRTFIID